MACGGSPTQPARWPAQLPSNATKLGYIDLIKHFKQAFTIHLFASIHCTPCSVCVCSQSEAPLASDQTFDSDIHREAAMEQLDLTTLGLVFTKLPDFEQAVTFGRVCKEWRGVARQQHSRPAEGRLRRAGGDNLLPSMPLRYFTEAWDNSNLLVSKRGETGPAAVGEARQVSSTYSTASSARCSTHTIPTGKQHITLI